MAQNEYSFSGSKTSVSKDEPLFLTKFKVTFVLPPPLQAQFDSSILSEQLQKIAGFDVDRLPAPVEQYYRSLKRRFVGTVATDGDAIDLDVTFNVNVNKDGIIYPYNILRAWSKLCYDPRTGLQLLKPDYTGQIVVELANKVGTVLKKFYSPCIFPSKPINSYDLEYKSENMYELNMAFAVEDWTELIIGDPQ
jgi:hypothetical protein